MVGSSSGEVNAYWSVIGCSSCSSVLVDENAILNLLVLWEWLFFLFWDGLHANLFLNYDVSIDAECSSFEFLFEGNFILSCAWAALSLTCGDGGSVGSLSHDLSLSNISGLLEGLIVGWTLWWWDSSCQGAIAEGETGCCEDWKSTVGQLFGFKFNEVVLADLTKLFLDGLINCHAGVQ
jgi:hypothetical protein